MIGSETVAMARWESIEPASQVDAEAGSNSFIGQAISR